MKSNSIDFVIYNLLDIQEYGFQKCLIPKEHFIDNIHPGVLAKCLTNREEIFLCYIFSLRNNYPKEYCFLDDSIQITKTFNVRNGTKIINIIPVNEAIFKVEKLNVSIILNKSLFEFSIVATQLCEIIREWLLKFTLYENCAINGDEFIKSLGIERILVTTDLKVPFELTTETEIILNDIQYNENTLKYTELKGLYSVDEELNKFIKDFKLQEKSNWKIKPSFNVLVIGPTGCGKTSVCNNFFLKNQCNVFTIRPSDIIREYPGETEEALRKLFVNAIYFATEFKPKFTTIIYIEDIEILCPIISSETSDSYNLLRISSQIYSILDDIHLKQIAIMIVATTSQIDAVNSQLRRPGRFEKEIQIQIPTIKDREEIIKLNLELSEFKNVSEEMIFNIAERTPGFVGVDLMLVIQKVLQLAVLKNKSFDELELYDLFDKVLKNTITTSIQSSDIKVYKCEETFNDIGGSNELKNYLKVSVLTPLKRPDVFKTFGLQLPKGILLYGPPGCAKTTVAKCLANETNMTFISISGAEVYSPYVGNAEKYIVKIFDTARKNSPCLIFFDEIETLVGKRNLNSKSDVQTRILSALLQEMDGIGLKIDEGNKIDKNVNHILVVGATNRPDMIDDALIRPGRFDKLIHVPAPNTESRLEILKLCKNKIPFDDNLNLMNLVNKTELFSGADLCNLCNEAALYAFTKNNDINVISEDDFNIVLKDLKPSLTEKQIEWYNSFENKYFS